MGDKEFLGDSPGDHRIGVIALANDQIIERDLGRMLPQEILTYTTRIAFDGDCTLERLAGMAPMLADATRLLNPEVALDAVVFGCTSGTIAIGANEIQTSIQKAAPSAIVINPVDAVCDAFASLGARRMNLLTPYEPELADRMAQVLTKRGFGIANRFDFGLTESAEISRVTPKAISAAACALPRDGVEITFISCTDFQSLYVLDEIEAATGLPAIASNQAIVWALLKALNNGDRPKGFGSLLSSDQIATTNQGEKPCDSNTVVL